MTAHRFSELIYDSNTHSDCLHDIQLKRNIYVAHAKQRMINPLFYHLHL